MAPAGSPRIGRHRDPPTESEIRTREEQIVSAPLSNFPSRHSLRGQAVRVGAAASLESLDEG